LSQARKIIGNDQGMMAVVKTGAGIDSKKDEMWFDFINSVGEQLLQGSANSILKSLSGANLFDIFSTIGSAGSLYTMLAPFFISYGIFTKDRKFCQDYLRHAGITDAGQESNHCRVAHFTDTFNGIDGMERIMSIPTEEENVKGNKVTMITCGLYEGIEGVVTFKPIGEYEIAEWPDIKLYYPPLLTMLDYCYKEGFTHIYSSTPGPMGLAAMLTAKILRLPHSSAYNAAFPQIAERLTTDHNISELVWRYIIWFYNHTERVFVPSHAIGKELEEKGIRKGLISKSPWPSVEEFDFGALCPENRTYYDAAA
jgi:hypothetical protein